MFIEEAQALPPTHPGLAKKAVPINRPPAKKLRIVAASGNATNTNASKAELQITSRPNAPNNKKEKGRKLHQQSIVVALTGSNVTTFVWDDFVFGEYDFFVVLNATVDYIWYSMQSFRTTSPNNNHSSKIYSRYRSQ